MIAVAAKHGPTEQAPWAFKRAPRYGRSSRPVRRRGLSLVEVCISLTISAALLVAVGAAYSSSVNAIQSNDTFFRATQAARVSLNQILTEVRRCESATISSNQIAMTTYNGESRTYAWSNTTNELTITRDIATPAVTNVMAGNITSLTFATDTQTVTMSITVTVGNNTVTFSGAATPRRMIQYD